MKIYSIFILLFFASAGKANISVIKELSDLRIPVDSVELLSHHWNFSEYAVNGNKMPVDKARPGSVDIRKTGEVDMKRFGNTTSFKWSLLAGNMSWKIVSPEKSEETLEWRIVELSSNTLKLSSKVDGAEIMMILSR
ncbi:MAG TPA: hypothetical protein VGO21_01975 [Candidatus Paceibacterota bacterium]|jgi:hypothetical protein|nr:hypothetical protein [Candidatus Paceibacterota bacterium]